MQGGNSLKMKAVILAAGRGTRLKEISENTPKPMLVYNNKPILEYNIELCIKYGIDDIFINTHYLPHIIRDYFGDGKRFGVSIQYSYESQLLGTAGALINFKNFLDKEPFFVIYGDNISQYPLSSLVHRFKVDCIVVIGFHYREDISHSGVAEFDKDYRVVRFLEKPKNGETESHWVNAGIYYLSPKIFKYIPEGASDFGQDIFPKLLNSNIAMYGVCDESALKSFDTIDMYKKSIKGICKC